MSRAMVRWGGVAVWAALLAGAPGCGDEEPAAPAGESGPEVPALGVLELPVSLRADATLPSGARKVEVTPAGIRVDDKALLALEGSRVPASEQQDGVIGKLKDALASAAGGTLALGVHSATPYETAAPVLETVKRAGIDNIAFQVRKGAGTDTGWLDLKGFSTTKERDGEVELAGVDARSWDEFAAAWQAIHDACRGSQTGSCAYVQENVAKGGKLKIVLHAAGQGVNLNFYRVGLSPEQLKAEEQAHQAQLAKQKEDVVQGRGEPSELEKEMLEGPPASQALFQFRAREALASPSPVSATLAPLCGPRACGAVVSAEKATPMVRVVSLIGAAFPDGTAPPVLAFELP